jgi:AcrR family transcriptional regulator
MPAPATASAPEEVVDAALACFADYGVRKTSLTDVARRAGVSRATAYRMFAGKEDLVAAVARVEVARFGAQLGAAIDWEAPFEGISRQTIEYTLRYLRDHAALQRVLADEPEQLVDLIVERPGRTTLISLLQPGIAATLEPYRDRLAADPEQVAEWGIRLIFSMLLAPGTTLDGPGQVTELLLAGALRR